MDELDKKIIFPAEVVDNQDPMILGRVRAHPLDKNVRAALDGFNFNPTTDLWGPKDPFVCSPLLPQFISQVPEVKERVNLIYQNRLHPYQDVYYVQAAFSSPMTLTGENIQAANKFTSLGDRVKGLLRLKNNDGTFKNTQSFGIFPEPGDNAILGRGFSDIIVKRDTVLLRAAKTDDLNVKRFPIPNNNRSFIQLSGFDNKIVLGQKKTLIKTEGVNLATQKLIEWDIQNLENAPSQSTGENAFTGQVRLYSLKPLGKVYTDVINYDSDLEDVKFLEYYENFVGLTFDQTISKINNFIKGVNEGKILNGPVVTSQFPFVYRPVGTIRNIIQSGTAPQNSVSAIEYSNALRFANSITLSPGLGTAGYYFAIVRTKNEIGRPIKVEFEEIQTKEVTPNTSTVNLMGADTVYLLSQQSNKKIKFENSIYGFTQTQIEELIHPNTSSMVRGEELIELLNLIVRFLTTHVHPIPGTPPINVGTDGTSVNQILFELQNAANKILNPNIRIN
jgi:hypothetical protein